MFSLTGLTLAGGGRLFTYEPNLVWADIAESNLRASFRPLHHHPRPIRGMRGRNPEPSIGRHRLNRRDPHFGFRLCAIGQAETYLKADALVLFDDVDFSSDMGECWRDLAYRAEIVSSYQLGDRVGLVELGAAEA